MSTDVTVVHEYYAAAQEAQRLWSTFEAVNAKAASLNKGARDYLKEHGPVEITLGGTVYQARLSPLGSPVLVSKEKHDD